MKIPLKPFRVKEGDRVDLKQWPTKVKRFYQSKDDYDRLLAKHREEMSGLQTLLYAENKHALLLIFQAMDAAGKDGAIKHVMSGVNPQGCQVFSFKHPSAEELDHDFLWRTTRALPERGRIGIFNRSYYEEVLIVKVHPELLTAENVPGKGASKKDAAKFWEHRYDSITGLEKHLHRSGTRVVKFFLHLSKEEQRCRFLARIDDPDKNWKFGSADLAERQLWKQYQAAYAECLAATSTDRAPWYVIPADDKENARLIISSAILETLRDLKMSYPETTAERRKELQKIRGQLLKE
jgi:PPK2 family polyphosphate:nucleotide phosphotransferase